MKKIVVLFLALALLLGMTTAVSAQAGTWVSGIYVKNLDATHSNEVTVAFYWAEGYGQTATPVHTMTQTLTPDGTGATSAWSIYVPNVTQLPENFVGSAVVTAQYAVAANLNTQLPPTTTGDSPTNPVRVGTSTGVLDPGNTLYFTQVMKQIGSDSVGYFNSYIAVQNTSASSQATVTVKYFAFADGAEVVAARQTGLTIAANSTRIIRQSDSAALPNMWQGTCVVEGNQPLAGIANFYNSSEVDTKSQFNSYNAFTAGATKLYLPRASRNLADYQGAISLMNVGAANTNVTLQYKMGGNTYTQVVSNLAPFAGKSIYLAGVTELTGVNGTGAATITSSGGVPIVATVNEDNRGASPVGHGGRSITYSGFADGSQTTTVVFPQITAKIAGYSSGVQVMNVGATVTTATFTFSGGTQDYTVVKTIQPGESVSIFAPDVVAQTNFNGSCVVTSSDQPIVGIANTSLWWAPTDPSATQKYGDSYLTYNGINK